MELISTRKLQRVSGSVQVSIPITWLNREHIERQDLVDIYTDGELLIITKHRECPK
jgi:hypothetical protein